LLFGEVINVSFEVGGGEGAKWSVVGGFPRIFDEGFVFLKFVRGLLYRSFYNPDLRMRKVVFVISVPEL
jgi:hypothetical protein